MNLAGELRAGIEALGLVLHQSQHDQLLEYLYLLETWYRDAAIYGITGDATHVLHRDLTDRLAAAPPADLEKQVAAIEKARVYLERFINEGRVFRDLFFALAR